MTALPFAGFVVILAIVLAILNGFWAQILGIFGFFQALMVLTSLLTIRMEKEDWKLALYSPFFVLGYKHFLDLVKIKALFDVLRGGEFGWTRARRAKEKGTQS